eukprot:scaffold29045_cov118-Isochrysis_galbana.AAC.1
MSISSYASDSSAATVNRIRRLSATQSRPVSRAWFSPSSKRCLRPCTPPVRLFSVYSVHVQPSIRQSTEVAPEGCADGVGCGACSCKLVLSDARGPRGGGIVCSLCWSCIVVFPPPAGCSMPFFRLFVLEVLRLCSPPHSGPHLSADLRHLPIRVVWCARLWQALPVSVDRESVVTNWLASIAGAFYTGLELTMLPDAGSRGRFCADMSVGAVSAGPEAD